MFFKLRPLTYSLIFFIVLEIIIFYSQSVFELAIFLIFLVLFESKYEGKKWKYAIIPVFFTASTIALLYLITLFYEQQLFILSSTFIFYLALFGTFRLGKYADDQTARGMLMTTTVTTIFFTYSSVYGIYLNFLVPLWLLILAYVLVTLLVSYQYFSIIEQKRRQLVWIYSFLLALVMAEFIWTMNFWPFGYLTTGVIALILYYILWDIIQSYFLDILSRKRVLANSILFSILIVFILLSSKWIPVI